MSEKMVIHNRRLIWFLILWLFWTTAFYVRRALLKEKKKMESYLITMGISTILMALKSDATKRKFRNAFLKVFTGIKAAFADDEAFQ